jgi:hypothetical protein
VLVGGQDTVGGGLDDGPLLRQAVGQLGAAGLEPRACPADGEEDGAEERGHDEAEPPVGPVPIQFRRHATPIDEPLAVLAQLPDPLEGSVVGLIPRAPRPAVGHVRPPCGRQRTELRQLRRQLGDGRARLRVDWLDPSPRRVTAIQHGPGEVEGVVEGSVDLPLHVDGRVAGDRLLEPQVGLGHPQLELLAHCDQPRLLPVSFRRGDARIVDGERRQEARQGEREVERVKPPPRVPVRARAPAGGARGRGAAGRHRGRTWRCTHGYPHLVPVRVRPPRTDVPPRVPPVGASNSRGTGALDDPCGILRPHPECRQHGVAGAARRESRDRWPSRSKPGLLSAVGYTTRSTCLRHPPGGTGLTAGWHRGLATGVVACTVAPMPQVWVREAPRLTGATILDL